MTCARASERASEMSRIIRGWDDLFCVRSEVNACACRRRVGVQGVCVRACVRACVCVRACLRLCVCGVPFQLIIEDAFIKHGWKCRQEEE